MEKRTFRDYSFVARMATTTIACTTAALGRLTLTASVPKVEGSDNIPLNKPGYISADDPVILELAQAFCTKWRIKKGRAAANLAALAAGYQHLPVILLLNPSKRHNIDGFTRMIDMCPTLCWIQDCLRTVGLSIDEVSILDVCPLLDDYLLGEMENEDPCMADRAVKDAFVLTRQLLRRIGPPGIICCQCATTNRKSAEDKRGYRKPQEIIAANSTHLTNHFCSSISTSGM